MFLPVITARNVRDRLAQTPFRRFRICLSDGTAFDVPHSEFAWVFGNRVFVGLAANGNVEDDPPVREISDLHVTRIEDTSRPAES